MKQLRFWIQNANTGVIHDSLTATSQRDALHQWLGANGVEDERIVQCGRQRPYVTGDHGACYIALEADEGPYSGETPKEVAAMREP